jgi:hypothetical protein
MGKVWEKLKAYRTVAFHAAYGLPLAVITALDAVKAVDLSPMLAPFMTPQGVAAVGSGIAVTAVVLHAFSDTYRGSLRDNCKDCERHAFPTQ